MVIVQNFHEQKDTPCYKYLQSYKPFCFLNIFHILSSYMKMIRYTILGGKGEKGVFIISYMCSLYAPLFIGKARETGSAVVRHFNRLDSQ